MKRFLILLSLIFCNVVFADTININWIVDGQQYGNPTTCEYSGDVILPTPPTKYGYTFAGWEPGNYVFLEYIESTGTQWIDTGIITSNSSITTTNFEARAAYISSNRNFIASYEDVYTAHYCEFFNNKFGVNDTSFGYFSPTLSVNTPYDIYMQINGSENTILGISVNEENYSYSVIKYQNATMGKFSLFRLSSEYISSGLRIYRAKITINNTVVRDFIPAKRLSDDAVGMYDLVSGNFFGNAGTGTFIAGPVAN